MRRLNGAFPGEVAPGGDGSQLGRIRHERRLVEGEDGHASSADHVGGDVDAVLVNPERGIVRPATGIGALGGVEARLEPVTGGIVGQRNRQVDGGGGAEVADVDDPSPAVMIKDATRVAVGAGQKRTEEDVDKLGPGGLVIDREVAVDRLDVVVGSDRAVRVGRIAPGAGIAAEHALEAVDESRRGAQVARWPGAVHAQRLFLRAGRRQRSVHALIDHREIARARFPGQAGISGAGQRRSVGQIVEVDDDRLRGGSPRPRGGRRIGEIIHAIPAAPAEHGLGDDLDPIDAAEVHLHPSGLGSDVGEPAGLAHDHAFPIADDANAARPDPLAGLAGKPGPLHVDGAGEADPHARIAPLVDDVVIAGMGERGGVAAGDHPYALPAVAVLLVGGRDGGAVALDRRLHRFDPGGAVGGRIEPFAGDGRLLGESGRDTGGAKEDRQGRGRGGSGSGRRHDILTSWLNACFSEAYVSPPSPGGIIGQRTGPVQASAGDSIS